ncbi:MAG TPA: TIR domain-containing protein [Spirochaetia bacterium]|nr:TIR domain-containing protein [Spirochaetia bacterium]
MRKTTKTKTVKKSTTRKPAGKKPAAKKTTKKKVATPKRSAKKPVTKKTPKKAAPRKPAPKKPVARKSTPKKNTAKSSVARKPAAKKATPRKTAVKRAAPPKSTPKRKKVSQVKRSGGPKLKSRGTKTSVKKSAKSPTKKSSARKGTTVNAGKAKPVAKKTVKSAKSGNHKPPMSKTPFEAYKGTKPYVFVSYSHKNMAEVFGIIKKLNAGRYRIWYDEGIEPGNEWPEVVGKALLGCSQLLVFMSRPASISRNVRNEINLAFSESKNIMVVYLEKTRLSEGMKLQIGTVQFVNRFDMGAKEFVDKLKGVLSSTLRN